MLDLSPLGQLAASAVRQTATSSAGAPLSPRTTPQRAHPQCLARPMHFSIRHTHPSSSCFPPSRYIDDPLLVCGKKFDIRMYVLVTSYRPLRAWISDLAFCRFCTELYERDDLENTFVHLTNVAIQKHGESYNDKHGSKWPLRCLKLFLEGNYGGEATERLFERIRGVVLHSLKAVQRNMINDRHCFELYGYDLLIDADLKPWLLEARGGLRNLRASLPLSLSAWRARRGVSDAFRFHSRR